MSYTLIEILGYAIFIGAVIGLVRIFKIDQAFVPFIILLWIGGLNEVVNTVTINAGYSNAINDNIYGLVESLLITWLFQRQGLFKNKPSIFWWLIGGLLGAWASINFVVFSIKQFSSYFNILYAFIIVLMSLTQIANILEHSKSHLLKNALFLICMGFVFFFTYKMLVEIFWVYGLNESAAFRTQVYRILTYINLAVNLIFALAALWIPGKRVYTLL